MGVRKSNNQKAKLERAVAKIRRDKNKLKRLRKAEATK